MFCYTTVLSGVRHLDVHISSALPSFETQFESISRGGFYLQSRTWIPQCSQVSHFSAKLSLRSLCLPVSFVLCLPACQSLHVPISCSHQPSYFHSPLQTPTYSSSRVHYNFSGSACAGSSFPFSISDWEIQDFTQSVLCPNSRDSIFTQEK